MVLTPIHRKRSDSIFISNPCEKENGTYFKNLSFPLRIPGKTDAKSTDLKDIVGFEERGRARPDGSSGYKGKARGSNSSEGLWIASPNNTELKSAEKVLWFESAYDAMAYYRLNAQHDSSLNKAVFVSTGGNPTVMQFRGVINEGFESYTPSFVLTMIWQEISLLRISKMNCSMSNLKVQNQVLNFLTTSNRYQNLTIICPEIQICCQKNLRRAYGSYESCRRGMAFYEAMRFYTS